MVQVHGVFSKNFVLHMSAPFIHEMAYCHQRIELDCIEAHRRPIQAATASGAVEYEQWRLSSTDVETHSLDLLLLSFVLLP
jgi:hypothetical protein